MNTNSESSQGERRARWIGVGFVLAFATSVLTVIYTGLMVEGSPSEFDAGFKSQTMSVGEVRAIEFVFEAQASAPDATLVLSWPEMLEPADASAEASATRPVALEAGRNTVSVEVRASAPGSGYLVARVAAEDPIARDSVFVTVVEPE